MKTMIISEADAKTKWCPFTYSVPEQRGPDGCGIREGGPWTCCTTHCMAWRPAETSEFTKRADDRFRRTGERLEPNTGYCAALASGQSDGQ
jgi:hypothetical protein